MTAPLPPRLRQSFLKWGDVCLAAAKLYLDHDGGAPSPEKNRGTLAHYVFARMAHTMLEHGSGAFFDPDELALLDHGTKDDVQSVAGRIAAVTAAIVDEVADEHPELTVRQADKDKVRIMAYHFAIGVRLIPEQVAAIETTFVMDVEGATISGTIDLAQIAGNVAQIIDYKSGLYVPTQEQYEDSFQPACYSALLLFGRPVRADGSLGDPLGTGIQYVRTREVYPRLLTDEGELHYRAHTRSRAEIADFVNDLAGRVRQIRHAAEVDEWPATPGSHCGRCPAPALCPIPFALREGGLPDEESARTLAEGWRQEGLRRTAAQKLIKSYVQEHGELRFGRDLIAVVEPDSRMSMRLKVKSLSGEDEA